MSNEACSPVKRLYRSKEDAVIGGVLGGIGEYLGMDPVVVRVVYIVLAALTGFIPLLAA